MKNMTDKQQLFIMQVLVAFFTILSVIIALNPPTFIAQLMGYSWGALAGSFLAPFLYGLYNKKTTNGAVWASYIFGVGFTVGNMLFHFIKSPINAGALTMVLGLIIVPLVSLVTRKPDEAFVEDIFASYEVKVLVSKATSLEEEEA